jgi:hypothetical protein
MSAAGVAFARNRIPLNLHAVHRVDAGRQLVSPRYVVARARGQHPDVRVACQMLGHVPRVQFGAAADVGAVPLHDNGNLHRAKTGG